VLLFPISRSPDGPITRSTGCHPRLHPTLSQGRPNRSQGRPHWDVPIRLKAVPIVPIWFPIKRFRPPLCPPAFHRNPPQRPAAPGCSLIGGEGVQSHPLCGPPSFFVVNGSLELAAFEDSPQVWTGRPGLTYSGRWLTARG